MKCISHITEKRKKSVQNEMAMTSTAAECLKCVNHELMKGVLKCVGWVRVRW